MNVRFQPLIQPLSHAHYKLSYNMFRNAFTVAGRIIKKEKLLLFAAPSRESFVRFFFINRINSFHSLFVLYDVHSFTEIGLIEPKVTFKFD